MFSHQFPIFSPWPCLRRAPGALIPSTSLPSLPSFVVLQSELVDLRVAAELRHPALLVTWIGGPGGAVSDGFSWADLTAKNDGNEWKWRIPLTSSTELCVDLSWGLIYANIYYVDDRRDELMSIYSDILLHASTHDWVSQAECMLCSRLSSMSSWFVALGTQIQDPAYGVWTWFDSWFSIQYYTYTKPTINMI